MQRTRQLIAPLLLPQQPRFHHHLGQLFHEQRHTVGFAYHFSHQLRWQLLTARDPLDHRLHLLPTKSSKYELGDMRARRPGRAEVRSKRQQGQKPCRGHLINQER